MGVGYGAPVEPRPRRRWGWMLAALLVVLLLAGAVAAAITGRVLPYQADREQLTATPFVIRAQAGVPPADEDHVRAGLVAIHTHLDEVLGGDLDHAVEVRLTWSQGCEPLLGPTSVAPAWADDDLLCLNASHPGWRRQTDRHEWFPALAAAREHVHLWQQALGCPAAAVDQRWHWLAEGMADHLAFEAMEAAGIVAPSQTRQAMAEAGGLEPGTAELATHEQAGGGDEPRGLFHLATRELAAVAPSPEAFADFCLAAGGGPGWEEAFSESFGLPVDTLYARVADRVAARRGTG